jgi:hypothetical protein
VPPTRNRDRRHDSTKVIGAGLPPDRDLMENFEDSAEAERILLRHASVVTGAELDAVLLEA